MRVNYNYNSLIRKSLALAFKIDKILDISIRPKGYSQPLAGIMLDIMRYHDIKYLRKLLGDCKEVEIDVVKHFKSQISPSKIEFWYEVLTDWFYPLTEKEAFILRKIMQKMPVKLICFEFEKKYGSYPNRKTIYNWQKHAIEKIKTYLWEKEKNKNFCRLKK